MSKKCELTGKKPSKEIMLVTLIIKPKDGFLPSIKK